MDYIFINYEVNKLVVQNPNIYNTIILVIFVLFSIIFLRKSPSTPLFLDRNQTDQLKGIAILFLMLGHLWVHVSDKRPDVILSKDAVTMFLVLSGYGLVISYKNRSLHIPTFLYRRLQRVMIPYWVGTLIILFFDYLFLSRTYSVLNIIMTFLGININPSTRHMDYVRWYITFQLLWYFIFILTFSKTNPSKQLKYIIISSVIIFIFDRYISDFGWYQIYAFPFGCLLGFYYDHLSAIIHKHINYFILGSFFILFYIFFLNQFVISNYLSLILPGLILTLLGELTSIAFCFSIIVLISFLSDRHYCSLLLIFLGKISYEIFLLHGVFLIKYNPTISQSNLNFLPLSFTLLLLVILALSYCFHIFLRFTNEILF